MDLVETGCEQPVVAPLVQREPRVDDTRPAGDRADHLFGTGHLRYASGADEADRLDPRQPGHGEPVDQLGPDLRLDQRGVVLQAVAGGDVAKRDEAHRPHATVGNAPGSAQRPMARSTAVCSSGESAIDAVPRSMSFT